MRGSATNRKQSRASCRIEEARGEAVAVLLGECRGPCPSIRRRWRSPPGAAHSREINETRRASEGARGGPRAPRKTSKPPGCSTDPGGGPPARARVAVRLSHRPRPHRRHPARGRPRRDARHRLAPLSPANSPLSRWHALWDNREPTERGAADAGAQSSSFLRARNPCHPGAVTKQTGLPLPGPTDLPVA